MDGSIYLADAIRRFRETRSQCEGAFGQVPFEGWNRRLDPGCNSIVTLMLHLSGNLLSRWTDFLTSDGEKPGRDRDAEFEDPGGLGREALLDRWGRGWSCLFQTLEGLTEADLDRTVLIRAQPHSVVEAINRQLTHYAYHAGQMVFLAKHLAGASWRTLSVPRGRSAALNAAMAQRLPPSRARLLTDLPNIGKAIAGDLRSIGIHAPSQLAERDPLAVFQELARVMGHRHDPCVFYTLLSVKHFLDGGAAMPWWKFTAEGKQRLARE